MITRGHSNSYAIYRQLKKEAEEKSIRSMTYKNTNRRILLLVQVGVIEEIKYTERVPHGRIDYKLTVKGLEYLLPYILMHPEEVRSMVSYMNKFSIDKKGFGEVLLKRLLVIAETIIEYQKVTNIPYDSHELARLVNQFYDIIIESGSELRNRILNKDVKEILEILDKDKKKKKSA